MLEKPAIPDEKILACLQANYELVVLNLDFLPLGNDNNGWTYRVKGENGISYFLKLKPAPFYEATCYVPAALKAQGIENIVAPLPTRQNKFWTQLDELVVILYPFIEGDTGWKLSMAERHWQELGAVFKRVHSSVLSPELLLTVRKETFDSVECRWVKRFEAELAGLKGKNKAEIELISLWRTNRSGIRRVVEQMDKLADFLQENAGKGVICHADLHPGNILLSPPDRLFVIDWDDVMIAPKERDFLFVQLPKLGENAEASPFLRGYGETEIDWIALTYYRCERIIQDVAVYTQDVFFRDDLGEETKAQCVRGFGVIFEPEIEFEAVSEAAEHLPPNLRFNRQ